VTPEAAEYWAGLAAGDLRIQRCSACQTAFFYPRRACPECWSEDVRWIVASGRATLYSYVIIHRAAPEWTGDVPYVVAIVEIQEGPRMMSNIVGVPPVPENLQLDMPLAVRYVVRDGRTLAVFGPGDERAA
jgi:uncharacterized protein